MSDWVSTKEAAALMGVSISWLCKARRGDWPGPPYVQFNKYVQYDREEIHRFIEMHRHECPGGAKEDERCS